MEESSYEGEMLGGAFSSQQMLCVRACVCVFGSWAGRCKEEMQAGRKCSRGTKKEMDRQTSPYRVLLKRI